MDGPRGSNTGAIKLDGCQDCTVQRNWLHKVRVGGERELNSAGLHSFDMENTLIADNLINDVHAGIYHKRSSGGPGAQISATCCADTNIGVLYSVAGGGDPAHRNALVSENEFVQCGRGIVATVHETEEPSRDLMIRNNAFIDCREGISLLGVDDVTLLNNIFRVDEAAIVTIGDERRPVRISRSDFNSLMAPWSSSATALPTTSAAIRACVAGAATWALTSRAWRRRSSFAPPPPSRAGWS